MENEKRKQALMPSVIKRFQCKGAKCRYNCCQDWRITMSREEYHRWKKCGILPKGKQEGGKVRLCPEGVRKERTYAEIVLTEKGGCPYLTKEGLCQIQKEYGVKEMTNTCKTFPRAAHNYFGHMECSLSLGCERVLELLLEEKEGLLLEEGGVKGFEQYESGYTIQHRRRYPKLRSYYDIQTLCLALLQAEGMKLENRLLLLGMAVHKIESFYREGKGEETAAYIERFLEEAWRPEAAGILEQFPDNRPLAVYESVMSALLKLDIPDGLRKRALSKARKGVEEKRAETEGQAEGQAEEGESPEPPELLYYRECRETFAGWIAGREYFLENMMVMYLLWSNIPFKNLEKSMWENYLYLAWVYIMVKGCLILSLTEESTEEEMIDVCAALFRKLGHNEDRFHKIIEAYRKDGDTPAHLAILLRSL